MTVKDCGPLKGDAGALRVKKPKRKARKKTEMWRLNNQEAQKRFRKKQKVRQIWRRHPFMSSPERLRCLHREGRRPEASSGETMTGATCKLEPFC